MSAQRDFLEIERLGFVGIARMGTPLGGERLLFRCPCGQRAMILYLTTRFACRSCAALAYPSQREPPVLRAVRRARKMRDKLGGGRLFDPLVRPKGMHARTWHLRLAQYDRALVRHGAELARVLPKRTAKIEALRKQIEQRAA